MVHSKVNNLWNESEVPEAGFGEIDTYRHQLKLMTIQTAELNSNITSASLNLIGSIDDVINVSTPSARPIYDVDEGYACQGGCTDGTYIYYYVTTSSGATSGPIIKKTLTGTSYVIKKTLSLGHGNDMTYNPDTGLIYVATQIQTDDGLCRIDVIDPETLTKTGSKYIDRYVSAIAYDKYRKSFIGAYNSKEMYEMKLNENDEFEIIRTILCSKSDYVGSSYDSQGIACDSGFIYHSWSYPPQIKIEVFNWAGTYMGTISKSVSTTIGGTSRSMEVEWIDKTSKNGFLMGMYASATGNGRCYIYSFNREV